MMINYKRAYLLSLGKKLDCKSAIFVLHFTFSSAIISLHFQDKGFKFNFPDIFAKDEETEMEKKFDEYQEGILHNTQFVNRDRNGVGEGLPA